MSTHDTQAAPGKPVSQWIDELRDIAERWESQPTDVTRLIELTRKAGLAILTLANQKDTGPNLDSINDIMLKTVPLFMTTGVDIPGEEVNDYIFAVTMGQNWKRYTATEDGPYQLAALLMGITRSIFSSDYDDQKEAISRIESWTERLFMEPTNNFVENMAIHLFGKEWALFYSEDLTGGISSKYKVLLDTRPPFRHVDQSSAAITPIQLAGLDHG